MRTSTGPKQLQQPDADCIADGDTPCDGGRPRIDSKRNLQEVLRIVGRKCCKGIESSTIATRLALSLPRKFPDFDRATNRLSWFPIKKTVVQFI